MNQLTIFVYAIFLSFLIIDPMNQEEINAATVPTNITTILEESKLKSRENEEIMFMENTTPFVNQENNMNVDNVNEGYSSSPQPPFAKLATTTKKRCPCPCGEVPFDPVCGRTTNGITKTFESQCHLICHNLCSGNERYAVVFHGNCLSGPPDVSQIPSNSRKNIYSSPIPSNRRAGSGSLYASITPFEWQCDCSFCPETRWIRLDYYPICAECRGVKRTFDSWCHFDCENRCIRNAGLTYLYMHKGRCRLDQNNEIVASRTTASIPASIVQISDNCDYCNQRCNEFFEPVCAKNNKDEFLSFKSRCHLRCHNTCLNTRKMNEDFIHLFDGQCPWV